MQSFVSHFGESPNTAMALGTPDTGLYLKHILAKYLNCKNNLLL